MSSPDRVTAMTTTGEVTRYIGVEIRRDRVNHTLSLSQQPLIDKIVVKNNEVSEKSPKPIPIMHFSQTWNQERSMLSLSKAILYHNHRVKQKLRLLMQLQSKPYGSEVS